MFSSWDHLAHKTPSGSLNRLEFLQQLVTEFQTTQEQEAQEQVLANLANFAYDPINYEYMRQLNIIDLFLDMLTEANEKLVAFGMGGLCNLALDKKNKEIILTSDGIKLVTQCLTSAKEEILASAITTLMFLVTPASKSAITAAPILLRMEQLSQSPNKRISNLAQVYLQDYCTREQQQQAKALNTNQCSEVLEEATTTQQGDQLLDVEDIPLPTGASPGCLPQESSNPSSGSTSESR